jgi:hypothetical protein
MRVRLGRVTIWRIQCTTCKAVFTILPHFILRYRQMRPEVARNALMAAHGGLSLELCAVICHISPMALYRLICAFGRQTLVVVLTRCGLPLPTYFLVDEKHNHCLRACFGNHAGLLAKRRTMSRIMASCSSVSPVCTWRS